MSGVIPTDLESIDKEIYELLLGTPETTNRGRLMHLINAKAALGGVGGGGDIDPSEIAALGGAFYFGEYTSVDTVAEVGRDTRNIHLKDGLLTIPRSSIDEDTPFNEMSLVAQGFYCDFIIYLTAAMGDETFISRMNTFTLNRVGSDRYSLTNLQFTVMDLANVIQPELSQGVTVKLSAYPVPKGSGSAFGLGSHVLTTNIVGVDVESTSDFSARYRMYGNHQGGTDNTNIMDMSKLYVYNVPTSDPLNKLLTLQALGRSSLQPTEGFGAVIEVIQGGVILGAATATINAQQAQLDESNNVWEIPVSTRSAILDDMIITADLENPATVNVYIAP